METVDIVAIVYCSPPIGALASLLGDPIRMSPPPWRNSLGKYESYRNPSLHSDRSWESGGVASRGRSLRHLRCHEGQGKVDLTPDIDWKISLFFVCQSFAQPYCGMPISRCFVLKVKHKTHLVGKIGWLNWPCSWNWVMPISNWSMWAKKHKMSILGKICTTQIIIHTVILL